MNKKRGFTIGNHQKFYKMPQIFYNKDSKYFKLMKNGTARELYMLLMDRNELSIKNGWVDEDGYIYFYFKQMELMELLRVSKPTIIKAFNELKVAELVYIVQQGMNLPNIIYLLQPEYTLETQEELGGKEILLPESKTFTSGSKEILPPGSKNFTSRVKNLYPNNTEYNYTNNNNTNRANNSEEAQKIMSENYDPNWLQKLVAEGE